MYSKDWVLIDTETTGLTAPIYVVELAAQKMRGWERNGEPFRRLLNQNMDIPPEASRVHGYTREILERDGHPAREVYRDFSSYVGALPLVAYNLRYDLDDVLKPEWNRIGVDPIGTVGFCALRFAQRLLDPVPAGNCKLQTLRQFYRLPERGAHTALGDVGTVADLITSILLPLASRRGLISWPDILGFTTQEWYPSRLGFGKFKGRNFRDAGTDKNLRDWLRWLSSSSNLRSANIGKWYLAQLNQREVDASDVSAFPMELDQDTSRPNGAVQSVTALVSFFDPQIDRLRNLVAAARARLAQVQAEYTRDLSAVSVTQATIFNLVKDYYQKRDSLRLLVSYRRKYLEVLLAEGEDEAAEIRHAYEGAKAQSDSAYEQAAATASDKAALSPDEEVEIKALWRKLVSLYHPDRFAKNQDSADTYENLIKVINQARDDGNLILLREIADDPTGFILKQGWAALDFSEEKELNALQKLLASLQTEILTKLEALNTLREGAEYELYRLSDRNPRLLEEAAADLIQTTVAEIIQFEVEAERLKHEIEELTEPPDTTMAA